MVTKCVVPNCGNACNAKLSVTLFSFPKDSKLIQKWLHATRAHYLKDIKTHHKVCSDHFEKRCIVNHFGATRLVPGSIPSIFEWNRSTNERSQRTGPIPILAIRNFNNPLSNNRIILPKPTLPNVTLPPLDIRIPHLVSSKSGLDLIKNEPLMCDVILPGRENTPSHQPTDSEIMFYEEPTSNLTPTDQDSEDDEYSNESEHILGDFGNYTLSTKLPKNYKEKVEGEKIPFNNGEVSEESSHSTHLDEDGSQEFSNCGSSLIEEITESLQDDADNFSCVKDIATFSPSGEVIIEECSIIEEEIIPPEKASTPLSLSVFPKDENVSVATKKITEPDVQRGAVAETISGKSQCDTNLQTTTKKRPPVSTRTREIVQDTKSKLRKLQPKVDNVGVAPPVVFRVGNMVLPASSTLVNTTQVAVQNHALNSPNLMTPQMAYLIPFRGVITPTVAVKSCNNPDKGKPTISDSGQSKSSDGLTKKELATPRRTIQKKRISRNAGNPTTLKSTASASSSIHSRCVDERSKIAKRFSLKLREMKVALRKKDILVKKLIKNNMHLTQKLTILRRAFLTSRKDSVFVHLRRNT